MNILAFLQYILIPKSIHNNSYEDTETLEWSIMCKVFNKYIITLFSHERSYISRYVDEALKNY